MRWRWAIDRLKLFVNDTAMRCRKFAPIIIALTGLTLHAQTSLPPANWFAEAKPVRPGIYNDGWIDFNKNGRKDVFEDPGQPVDKRVEDLLSQMTVEEKTCQLATLYGYGRVLKDPLPTPAWTNEIWKDGVANIDEMHNGNGPSGNASNPHIATPAATVKALNEVERWFIEETRLGIPAEFTDEGIRGLNYRKTVNFPADIGLGAAWDRDLISQVGDVVGREARAIGYRNVYAPILDLARDPRWGRVLDCYSEDPYLVSEMGIRMTRAIQARGIISTAKHFAVYSEPKGGRDGNDRTDPHVASREMEMLHLRPWERDVREGGLLGAMCSYNDYDGVPIAGSSDFMIERLRRQWGFHGYIVSDSEAVEYLFSKHHVAASADDAAAMFLREGGNVRTTFKPPETFILPVRREIAAGKLAMDAVNDRVRDVLRVKFIEGLFDSPYRDPDAAAKEIGAPESKAVALRAARESLVLLKNADHTLPLGKNLKRLLVCGPTAKMKETSLDRYGSNGGEVVSPFEGIETLLKNSGTAVLFAPGCAATDTRWPESELFPEPPTEAEAAQITEAVELGKTADAIVVFLGDSKATIGESKSRTSLDLPGYQTDLARALVKTGKPVIAVLLTGKPASINWVNRHVPAVLEAWFPGEAGGTAIAEALFGDYNPGGKLTVTFPRTVGQIPFNFPYKPGSQVAQSRQFDPNGFGNSMAEGVLYPFGFGLSYTTFEYANLKISPAAIPANGEVIVTCEIKNTGDRAGDEVAQLYFHQETSSVTTYELNLCGFERVSLQPGETKTVTFKLPASALELINRKGQRVVEPGAFKIMVGSSSTDLRLNGGFEVVSAVR
jgi:beta-glucosidase